MLLTEEQIAALEKAKSQKEAHGEIETHHSGYLGSQDTYFVGRIYQQTFVDTYSRVAMAMLYLAMEDIFTRQSKPPANQWHL